MVLGGDDEHLEAGILQSLDHGVSIEVGLQLEDLIGGLVPVVFTPFDLVEGVGAKVAERGQLCLLIPILIGVGHNFVRGGCCGGVVGERRIPDVGGLCGPGCRKVAPTMVEASMVPAKARAKPRLAGRFPFMYIPPFYTYGVPWDMRRFSFISYHTPLATGTYSCAKSQLCEVWQIDT